MVSKVGVAPAIITHQGNALMSHVYAAREFLIENKEFKQTSKIAHTPCGPRCLCRLMTSFVWL